MFHVFIFTSQFYSLITNQFTTKKKYNTVSTIKLLLLLLKKSYFHSKYLYYCTSMHDPCHCQNHFRVILCIFLSTKWQQILLCYSHTTGQHILTLIPDSWLRIQIARLYTYNIACTEINIQVILRTSDSLLFSNSG